MELRKYHDVLFRIDQNNRLDDNFRLAVGLILDDLLPVIDEYVTGCKVCEHSRVTAEIMGRSDKLARINEIEAKMKAKFIAYLKVE